MSKNDLVRHLTQNECQLLRQGKHEIWLNPANQMTSPVPRHAQVDRYLVKKICRELGIPNPPGI